MFLEEYVLNIDSSRAMDMAVFHDLATDFIT